MRLLLLLLFISCGKEDPNGRRCYTKEEAKSACILEQITTYNQTSDLAEFVCAPQFTVDYCYYID